MKKSSEMARRVELLHAMQLRERRGFTNMCAQQWMTWRAAISMVQVVRSWLAFWREHTGESQSNDLRAWAKIKNRKVLQSSATLMKLSSAKWQRDASKKKTPRLLFVSGAARS